MSGEVMGPGGGRTAAAERPPATPDPAPPGAAPRTAAIWAARTTALLGAIALVVGCSRPPPDASPEGVVRMFLDEMDSAGDDPDAIRRVYDLLGPASRANLHERARRASELQGRHVQPWDMMAAGLFGLAFRPKAMRSTVVGDRANVEVLGEDPRTEHATVVCVHEAAGWRVEPGFPDP